MLCNICNGTGQLPDPIVPKCGWCKDTGMAPWIMGDWLRCCEYCESGKRMRELGYGRNPFAVDMTRELAEKHLGPLTDERYEAIMDQYSKLRREAL